MRREDGFLSQDATLDIAVFRKKFAPWISLLQRLNRLAMTVLYAIKFNSNDSQKLCEATMFSKAVQHLQAGIILAERGLAADARSALRSATETAIFQRKVSEDPSFIDCLEGSHEHHRRSQARAMIDDPDARARMSEEDIKVYEKVVADITEAYRNKKNLLAAINTKEVAKSIGALAFYNTIFKPTSSDSAHPSLASMSRYYRDDPQRGQHLIFGPQDNDAESTLSGLANVFLETTMRTVHSFRLEQYEAEVLSSFAEFRKIAGLSPAASTAP